MFRVYFVKLKRRMKPKKEEIEREIEAFEYISLNVEMIERIPGGRWWLRVREKRNQFSSHKNPFIINLISEFLRL